MMAKQLITLCVSGELSAAKRRTSARMPASGKIIGVYTSIGTPATGATVIADVNIADTTIFTTQANRPTIASGAYSSVAGTAANNKFALGDVITVDIDRVGTEISGEDLTIGIWVDFDY